MTRNALKASWQVTAGVVPGHPDNEMTKRWLFTSDDYARDDGPTIFKMCSMEDLCVRPIDHGPDKDQLGPSGVHVVLTAELVEKELKNENQRGEQKAPPCSYACGTNRRSSNDG